MGNEGSYSNNPADPGGETMYGITKRVALEAGYTGQMRNLPLDTAKDIAKKRYWDLILGDQYDPEIAFQAFDAIYNGGPAVRWLQQASGANVDGMIGPATIAAIRSSDKRAVIMRFDAYRLKYLAALGAWGTFGKGWCNRIANNLIEGAD